MLMLVRIFFFSGLLVSLVFFILFLKGRGERYKTLGKQSIMATLLTTLAFFILAIIQKLLLEP